jgi:hypothetical protein
MPSAANRIDGEQLFFPNAEAHERPSVCRGKGYRLGGAPSAHGLARGAPTLGLRIAFPLARDGRFAPC